MSMAYHTLAGITFTGHAVARMKSRDIPVEAVTIALRSPTPRRLKGDRWVYRITAAHAKCEALRPWVGVAVLWDAADAVVITVFWEDVWPVGSCTPGKKVYSKRGTRRGWVYVGDQRKGRSA